MSTAHLMFRKGEVLFALDASTVREVFPLPDIAPVPNLPRYLIGVINHRGHIVPVIDLDVLAGRRPAAYRLSDNLIVFEWQGRLRAILVSEVLDVRDIRPVEVGAVHLSPEDMLGRNAYVNKVAKEENRIALVLDPAVLAPDDRTRGGLPESPGPETAPGQSWDYSETSGQEGGNGCFMPAAGPAERSVLRERALSIMRTVEREDLSEALPVAVIRLGQERWGIALGTLEEFAQVGEITPVPCCPPYVVGDMNLRGEVVTLLDVRGFLNLPAERSGTLSQAVIVRVDTFLVGVVVDEILDLIHLDPRDVSPVPTASKVIGAGYLKGTAVYGGSVLSLLDLPKILANDELTVNEEA